MPSDDFLNRGILAGGKFVPPRMGQEIASEYAAQAQDMMEKRPTMLEALRMDLEYYKKKVAFFERAIKLVEDNPAIQEYETLVLGFNDEEGRDNVKRKAILAYLRNRY